VASKRFPIIPGLENPGAAHEMSGLAEEQGVLDYRCYQLMSEAFRMHILDYVGCVPEWAEWVKEADMVLERRREVNNKFASLAGGK